MEILLREDRESKIMRKKLIIVMPSYNKKSYIEEALQSALKQNTNFDYGIIVADDASTDGTDEILKYYEAENTSKIKVLYSAKNQGLLSNILRVYEEMDSDYFCVLDADDYWVDENFLQKAVDFLDNHLDYTCYSQNTLMLQNGISKGTYCSGHVKEQITDSITDYFVGKACIPHTTGAVYRNVIYRGGAPDVVKKSVGTYSESSYRGDHERFVMHLKYGKAMFKNELAGVYRLNDTGIWVSASRLHQNLLNAQMELDMIEFYDYAFETEFLQLFKKYFSAAEKDINDMILKYQKISLQDKEHIRYLREIYHAISDREKQQLLLNSNAKLTVLVRTEIGKQDELLWANIFHDTIKGSKWFNNSISLSPGRWALGYPACYILYQILDLTLPENILELGLGVSTKFTGSYVSWRRKETQVNHYVVEHDKEWIEFNRTKIDYSLLKLVQLNNVAVKANMPETGDTEIIMYDGFAPAFLDKKFDFILIDAPYGSEGYSRVDCIGILPQCLKESFVIMLDDYNRMGEKRTAQLFMNALKDAGIPFEKGVYQGEKSTLIITSLDYKFLCSL